MERVTSFKFWASAFLRRSLGPRTHTHTRGVTKKAQQRLHLLKALRNRTDWTGTEAARVPIIAPLRAHSHTGSLHGLLEAQMQTGRLCRESSTLLRESLSALCPSWKSFAASRCLRRSRVTLSDPSRAAHHLSDLLLSNRCYRSINARAARMTNTFFP